MSTFTNRELAAVLAGLRNWQLTRVGGNPLTERVDDIATNGGEFSPLTPAEIDALCERLNFQPAPSNAPPLYVSALLDAARRTLNAGVGSKSAAAYEAHADLGDILLAYNGAPFAWKGRLTPDNPPYPHNPRNRVNPQVDDYVIAAFEHAAALDAAAPHKVTALGYSDGLGDGDESEVDSYRYGADGRVTSPGKFEGERRALVEAYESDLEGFNDESFGEADGLGYFAKVTPTEGGEPVFFRLDSQGFVCEITRDAYALAYQAESEASIEEGAADLPND